MSQQMTDSPPRTRSWRPVHRLVITLLAGVTALFGATAPAISAPVAPQQEQQVLTWTSGNSVSEYTSAPATAEAGPATIIFDNSVAAGNTSGMPHTLTFDTSTPGYNHDVDLNITANPHDANEGYYEAEITLTEGTYRYFCAIPGHGQMWGELVVTGDGGGDPDPGEDTTAPEVAAQVAGEQDEDGAYVGSAEVTITATDDDSGVESVEYSLDGGEYVAYEEPISVAEVGEHTVDFRATDVAGNTAEDSVSFTVVEGEPDPGEDTTAPEVAAEVAGEQDEDGAYVGSAEVTITATDDDSGVESVEYSLDGGEYVAYEEPISVAEVGEHTVDFRATDVAGNTAEDSVSFTVVEGDTDPGECPDTRETVIIDGVDTGVANADLGDGCTINDRIDEGSDYASHGAFVRHVGAIVQPLADDGVITPRDAGAILRAAADSEIGA